MGAQRTWLRRIKPTDRVIHLYSDKILGESSERREDFLTENGIVCPIPRSILPPVTVNDDSWTLPTYQGWDSILHKTISAFAYALQKLDFDFLVRTAPTSFWNPSALHKKLDETIQQKAAYGTIRSHFRRNYIEGSNLILSRESVEDVVTSNHLLNYGLIDDLALGDLFIKIGIPLVDWPRPRIERTWDFYDKRYGNFNEIYTFRCRQNKPYSAGILNKEIRTMHKIHKKLLQMGNY